MKQVTAKPIGLMIALLLALSLMLGACGNAATSTSGTVATPTTGTVATSPTAMMTTVAATMIPATAGAGTVTGDSLSVMVGGNPVVIKAGGGQKFAPKATVNVKIWSSQVKQNGVAFRSLMDQFEKENPNIKITVDNFNDTASYDIINEKLAQAATAGGLPNIATGYENWVPAFVDSKVILGLNKFISGPNGLSAKDLSDYRPQMLTRGIFPQYANETYTWVFSNSGPVMYYNQDLLDSVSLKVPTTWDEFIAASKAVSTKSAGKVAGLVFSPKTVSEIVAGMFSRGATIFDYKANKAIFTDKAAVDHLTMLYTGVKEGWLVTSDPNQRFDDQNRFIKGEAAFYIGSTSGRSYIATELAKEGAKKINWNGTVLPHGKGLQPLTTLYGGAALAFKAKSEDEDNATWEVLKFMGSAGFQAQWASSSGYVPATKTTIDNPTYKAFLDKAPQNKIPLVVFDFANATEPKIGAWQQMRKIFDDNVFALFQNPSGNPADTLKKIEDDSNKLLAK